MDSPIRQYQKQKDYQRHKLFRKIKRRKRAQAEQEAEAPIREMRKRVLKRFKDGKDKGISDQQYYSIMERVAENNNNEWNRFRTEEGGRPLSVDEEYLRILNDNSYDYRGYYNKYPSGSGNALDHWTDEFKTVWHPSFSTQSKYSGKVSQYNPYGILGGQWNGDNYVPAWGQKLASEPKQRGWFEYSNGKNIKRFDDGEDVIYESPDVPINISYVPKSNVRVNPETGAVLTRDNQEGALMLPEVEIRPKRRLEQVYKSDLGLSNTIPKKIQSFSRKHYWDPILGAPARWQASVDNGTNPLLALKNAFGVPDGNDMLSAASPFSYTGINTKDFFKNLTTKSYQEYISGIQPDNFFFAHILQDDERIIPRLIDDNMRKDLINSTLPRMQKQRPWIKKEELERDFNNLINGSYNEVPLKTYRKSVTNDKDFEPAGWYNMDSDAIAVISGEDPYWVIPHELRHKIDNHIPLTQKEEELLAQAFGKEFLDLPSLYEELRNYKYMKEDMVTTNRDARTALLGNAWTEDRPVHLQNMIIDKKSDDAVINAISKSNGYGRRLIEVLKNNNALTPERIKAFRESMKYVGGAAIPIGIFAPSYFSEQTNYNKGKDSGIHINPKNRGKFNALKKRTGKTTEQLTHSKNPLTRKRAIFAQNARKWHHK